MWSEPGYPASQAQKEAWSEGIKTKTTNKNYPDGRVYELEIRLNRCRDAPTTVLSSSETVAQCFADLADRDREMVCVACLDTRNQLIARHTVFIGSTNMAFFQPREILRTALLAMATQIILVHNHPTGIPEPSREDLEVTARLAEACEMVGIQLLDHVIIGRDGKYWSWADVGKPDMKTST